MDSRRPSSVARRHPPGIGIVQPPARDPQRRRGRIRTNILQTMAAISDGRRAVRYAASCGSFRRRRERGCRSASCDRGLSQGRRPRRDAALLGVEASRRRRSPRHLRDAQDFGGGDFDLEGNQFDQAYSGLTSRSRRATTRSMRPGPVLTTTANSSAPLHGVGGVIPKQRVRLHSLEPRLEARGQPALTCEASWIRWTGRRRGRWPSLPPMPPRSCVTTTRTWATAGRNRHSAKGSVRARARCSPAWSSKTDEVSGPVLRAWSGFPIRSWRSSRR